MNLAKRTALGVALGMIQALALASAASAGPIVFTWDPSKATPALAGPGSAFTADTIDMTTFLHSVNQSNGSFVEDFIFPVNGFELNGLPVAAPGLNSSYGLYFTIHATGPGAGTTFSTLNIALMGDPGHNNGPVSSTPPGVSFSNTGPTGAADDITLGTGTLVSGVLSFDPVTGTRHAHFVEAFSPAPNETAFFVPAGGLLEEFLTTPPSAFSSVPGSNNTTINMVNGGISQADFAPEPASVLLWGSSLFGLALIRRRTR